MAVGEQLVVDLQRLDLGDRVEDPVRLPQYRLRERRRTDLDELRTAADEFVQRLPADVREALVHLLPRHLDR